MNLELEGKAFLSPGQRVASAPRRFRNFLRPVPTSLPAIEIAPAWINSDQNATRCFLSAPTSPKDLTSFKPWKRVASNSGGIDSVLHFAGILDRHQLDDVTIDIWDQVMAVNLRGTFLLVQAVVPIMRKQNGGRIVLTASDSARMGSLVSGPAYAASKGGVIALTHSFALTLGKWNITCNAVCPGLVATGMSIGWEQEILNNVSKRTPLGRIATADEVARVAIFLGSDGANFVNGEVVEVNGGIHFD